LSHRSCLPSSIDIDLQLQHRRIELCIAANHNSLCHLAIGPMNLKAITDL